MPSLRTSELYFLDTNVIVYAMGQPSQASPTTPAQALQGYDPKQHDFNDRLIVQAMRAHGVVRILTADQGFERVKGVTQVSPVGLAKQLGMNEDENQ